MATIISEVGGISSGTILPGAGRILNQSGIGLNIAKLLAMPAGWRETPDYEEDWVNHDGGQVTRTYQGPWQSRVDFVQWALGWTTSIIHPQTGRPALFRTPPAQDPVYPWLYCTAAQTKGVGNAVDQYDPLAVYILPDGRPVQVPAVRFFDNADRLDTRTALVRLRYTNVPYEVRTDNDNEGLAGSFPEGNRYLQREKTYGMRAVPVDRGVLKFIEGPPGINDRDVPDTSGQILFPGLHLRYTWHEVPEIPEAAIAACVGRVNRDTWDGCKGWPSYGPEQVLFYPPEVTRYRSSTGRIYWRIVIVAAVQPRTGGWNAFAAANGEFYNARYRSSAGAISGSTLTGNVSGSIDGILDGDFDSLPGVWPLSGTFAGSVALTSFTGTDNGSGTVTGTGTGPITGTYSDANGDHFISGVFQGNLTVQLTRQGERVYKLCDGNSLFVPVASVAVQ